MDGTPRSFLLVHGAWHGGWCWVRVAERLRGAGHRVYTPTLTGLADRVHLNAPSVTVETHVTDILNLIEAEELKDIVLVGHSYGSFCVSLVTDRNPAAIDRLVLLDGGWPSDGKRLFDHMPAEAEAARRRSDEETGGLGFAPPSAAVLGVTDRADVAWLERRLTPQPLGTYDTPVRFAHPPGNGRPVTYIRCTEPRYAFFDQFDGYAEAQPDWQRPTIATGHDAMVTRPAEVADILLALA